MNQMEKENAGGVRHVGSNVCTVGRYKFQSLCDIKIGFFDIAHAVPVGQIGQDLCVYVIRIVDVTADADDVRIVLADKPGSHDGRRIVGGINGQMDIVMCFVKLVSQCV